MYLAYKYVTVLLMLVEINFVCPKLNLPVDLPVHRTDLKRVFVSSPAFGGSRVDTDNWSFCFSPEGRLCFIENLTLLDSWERMGIYGRNEMLVHQKSLIDTNGAYQMATNWIDKLCIPIARLAEKAPIKVEQEYRLNHQTHSSEVLPLFRVTWGSTSGRYPVPVLDLEIDGATKELVEFRMEDDSISQRPAGIVKERPDLLKISDEEFLTYSMQERKKLVAKYAAISYDDLDRRIEEAFGSEDSLLAAPKPQSVSVGNSETNAPLKPVNP